MSHYVINMSHLTTCWHKDGCHLALMTSFGDSSLIIDLTYVFMLLKHLNLTTVWLYKENRPQIYTNYLPVKMTADLWTERHRTKVSERARERASDRRRRSGNSSHSSVIPPLTAHVFLCSLTAGKQTSLSPSPSPPPPACQHHVCFPPLTLNLWPSVRFNNRKWSTPCRCCWWEEKRGEDSVVPCNL